MGRLLVGTALGLACGTLFGQAHSMPWLALPPALGCLAVACWRRSAPPLWLAALLAGALWSAPPGQNPALLRQLPLLKEVTGRVAGAIEPHRSTLRFVLESKALKAKLLCYLRSERPAEVGLLPGDRVKLAGEGELPSPEGWGGYLARRGIAGLFWADEVELLQPGGPSPLRTISRWRAGLLKRLRRLVPGGSELLSALLLGARGLLPEEAKQAFRTAGVAHLLALSGLHLGILAALGYGLLGFLRLRPGWRYLLLLPFLWGYVLLGGVRISLVRAGIMFTLLGLFLLLWERGLVLKSWHVPLEGLALAAVVVILLWPWSALDLGFQLSFAATFAILLLWPGWSGCSLRARLPRPVRWATDLLATSAFAQAGTLPLIGSAFGYFTPWGLLGNLLLIPWTGLLLGAGLFLLLVSPLPWAPAIGGFLHRLVVPPYLAVVKGLADLPGASLPVGEGFGLWCLLCITGVLILRELRLESGNGPGAP